MRASDRISARAGRNTARGLSRAGYLLGFSLGGFFDGILLHQILQWHHLLGAVPHAALRDMRWQILADGLFHLLMYLLALAGLLLLWHARRHLTAIGGGRLLLAAGLTGFGIWNVLDGLLAHWLLGLHRIRPDAASPLFWDLLWFFMFGVTFVVAGSLLRRQSERNREPATFRAD